jgi:hypothetical protein
MPKWPTVSDRPENGIRWPIFVGDGLFRWAGWFRKRVGFSGNGNQGVGET